MEEFLTEDSLQIQHSESVSSDLFWFVSSTNYFACLAQLQRFRVRVMCSSHYKIIHYASVLRIPSFAAGVMLQEDSQHFVKLLIFLMPSGIRKEFFSASVTNQVKDKLQCLLYNYLRGNKRGSLVMFGWVNFIWLKWTFSKCITCWTTYLLRFAMK